MRKFLESEDGFVKSSQTQHAWDANHEKLRIFAVFFNWMVEDSSKLVDDMTDKIQDMVLLPLT